MRKNGGLPRAPGDVPACGFPEYRDILESFIKNSINPPEMVRNGTLVIKERFVVFMLTHYHREILHFSAMNRVAVPAVDNHELRVKLLLKEIDEEKFKVLLQRADKAYRKSVAKRQIYDMTYNVAGDIFRNMINGTSIQDTFKSVEALLQYSNSALKRVSVAYSCVVDYYKIIEWSDEPLTYNNLLIKMQH
jgi:hypothetical protein